MPGLSRHNGATIPTRAHIAQSVMDILTTPLGSRVLARDYGSRLPDLVDEPLNDATKVEIFAATAEALRRHEPRIRVHRVSLIKASPGRATVAIQADDLQGRSISLDDVFTFGGAA